MAKILYGVSGEGAGHSSRAKLVARHLLNNKHELEIASYDRGYANLKDEFKVQEIVGLSIASRDNKVSMLKTISENVAKIPDGARRFQELSKKFKVFEPDCVITDFEPCSAYLAHHYKIPLISLDNQHRMRYMEYDCPDNLTKDAVLAETIIRAMVPRPWFSLITSFHFSDLKNDHCAVFPPLLRPAVLEHRPSDAGHILVYVTSGFDSLLELLKQFPCERFFIYGYNRNKKDNNLEYRPFSESGFLKDLASSKCVIATAGFTLISEALHFKKPYLALPMAGQFEQSLNAYMLNKQGLGRCAQNVDSDQIAAFLYFLPQIRQRLASYGGAGNAALCAKLDSLLANKLAKLWQYRR